MLRKKRVGKTMTIWLAASLALGACSSGQEAGLPPAENEQSDNEPAELTFFGNSTQSQEYFNRYYGDAIRQKFPNYKLNYLQLDNKNKATTLPELVASGTQIDIYYATVGNFESALTAYDLQVDLTDWLKTSGVNVSLFEPTLLEAMKVNTGGPIYGLPVQSNVETLYYNKDLFDKFGTAYPKDGMTWDDAAELARKMTRYDDKQYYGFAMSFAHMLRANQLSLARVDSRTGKPIINTDPGWRLFFDTLLGKVMQGTEVRDSFLKGPKLSRIDGFIKDQDVAMLAFFAQLYLTNPEELKLMNWDIVTLPTFKEKPGVGAQLYPMMFGPTKLTKNKEATLKVIRFLASEEYQLGLARKGWMSSLATDRVRNEYAQDTPFPDKNYKALFTLKPADIVYTPEVDPSLISILVTTASSFLKGEADMNTMLRTAEESFQKTIDEHRAQFGR